VSLPYRRRDNTESSYVDHWLIDQMEFVSTPGRPSPPLGICPREVVTGRAPPSDPCGRASLLCCEGALPRAGPYGRRVLASLREMRGRPHVVVAVELSSGPHGMSRVALPDAVMLTRARRMSSLENCIASTSIL
jgi:hypothetical protein